MAAPRGFVTVASGGHAFMADGKPFFFAGANSYYLMVGACWDGSQQLHR